MILCYTIHNVPINDRAGQGSDLCEPKQIVPRLSECLKIIQILDLLKTDFFAKIAV